MSHHVGSCVCSLYGEGMLNQSAPCKYVVRSSCRSPARRVTSPYRATSYLEPVLFFILPSHSYWRPLCPLAGCVTHADANDQEMDGRTADLHINSQMA
jgi:hypothetical protein